MIMTTLNFEYGSEQMHHIDTLYMPPPIPNKLIVTWIALEDCRPDAGPLIYYPGSHRFPPIDLAQGS